MSLDVPPNISIAVDTINYYRLMGTNVYVEDIDMLKVLNVDLTKMKNRVNMRHSNLDKINVDHISQNGMHLPTNVPKLDSSFSLP